MTNALVLLSQAADGNSYEEINDVLHLNVEKSEIINQFLEYSSLFKESIGNATFLLSNEIFVKEGHNLIQNFQEVATQKLLSGVYLVDFTRPVEASQMINNIIAEKTNGKIKRLFYPDDIFTANIVSVNAIYMKSKWQYKFEPSETFMQDFYLNEDEKVSVDFMHAESSFNYGVLSDLDAAAIELKYAESNLAFLIILPNSKTGWWELEEKLSDYDLSKVGDQLNQQTVKVAIPKFKDEFAINLRAILLSVITLI